MSGVRQVGKSEYEDQASITTYEAPVTVRVSERVGRDLSAPVSYETEVIIGGVTVFTHGAMADYTREGEEVAEKALRALAQLIRGGLS